MRHANPDKQIGNGMSLCVFCLCPKLRLLVWNLQFRTLIKRFLIRLFFFSVRRTYDTKFDITNVE